MTSGAAGSPRHKFTPARDGPTAVGKNTLTPERGNARGLSVPVKSQHVGNKFPAFLASQGIPTNKGTVIFQPNRNYN